MLPGNCGIRDHDLGTAAADPELPSPQRDKLARTGTAVHGEQQRGSFRLAGPGAGSCSGRISRRSSFNQHVSVNQHSTFNQYGTLDQGRLANGHGCERHSPDGQPPGPVAESDGGLHVRTWAPFGDLDGKLNELPVRRRT